MTDKKIIDIFKYCIDSNSKDCYTCVAHKNGRCALPDIDEQIVRILEHQRVEIDELLQKLQQAKSEAIKEFAERLKVRFNDLSLHTKNHGKIISVDEIDKTANWILHEVVPKEIDKIVKEMTRSDDE